MGAQGYALPVRTWASNRADLNILLAGCGFTARPAGFAARPAGADARAG